MMNVMLVSSSTLDNFWGEDILFVYHLQNIIPYKKNGLTPYKLWKDYSPNLKV
jgi:hypothetical protein